MASAERMRTPLTRSTMIDGATAGVETAPEGMEALCPIQLGNALAIAQGSVKIASSVGTLVVKTIRLVPTRERSGTTEMGWFRDRQVSDRESGNRPFAFWRKLGRLPTGRC